MILVLNSPKRASRSKRSAMLINPAGMQQELTCFDQDDTTEAVFSCSVNWQNELFIFGGFNEKRQISRLSGHKLERVGDLSFDHYNGACSVMADKFILLCFDWNNSQRCRRSTGPLETFSEVMLSAHVHQGIQTSCSDSKYISFSFSYL